jgi:hypothetical protein
LRPKEELVKNVGNNRDKAGALRALNRQLREMGSFLLKEIKDLLQEEAKDLSSDLLWSPIWSEEVKTEISKPTDLKGVQIIDCDHCCLPGRRVAYVKLSWTHPCTF